MPNNNKQLSEMNVAVVGAGLVGALLAVLLARRGMNVTMFERRPDMRKQTISAGRSINLNITLRGLRAMEIAGVKDEILRQSVPMMGRLMHSKTGELTYQPYGRNDSEYGNSISRAEMNKTLMTEAEATGHVKIEFNSRVTGIDLNGTELTVKDETSGAERKRKFDVVIGSDGSASAVREDMMKIQGCSCTQSFLDYGYKELCIPPSTESAFQMDGKVLHIWPRGMYMLIALPNFDGSFTLTLFLPYEGDVSFERLQKESDVQHFFEAQFPDAVPLIEKLVETFFENPTGSMVTVKCHPWHYDDSVLLLGDAAHAIVPFFGQGANCGFEDLTVLDELLDKHLKNGTVGWRELFSEFTELRKKNADAIADMAFENFIEMRDKVGRPEFLLQKAVEKVLEKHFPEDFASRYALVSFTHTPYSVCQEAGIVIDEMISELTKDITGAEQVDLKRAEKLISERLRPILKGRVREHVVARNAI